MTLFALTLVLIAAVVHASWNFTLKRSGGGAGVVTAGSALALLLYAPFVFTSAWRGQYVPTAHHLALMAASGTLHAGYLLLLDLAYRSSGGDLSVVYPLARATGPLLTVGAAIVFVGERPGPFALVGALLVGVSAIVLTGNPLARGRSKSPRAIVFALMTGCLIAGYTLFDRASVARSFVPPLIYDWGGNLFRTAILVPYTLARAPGSLTRAITEQSRALWFVAVLSPLSYILVLTAMVFTPVSLVAPARELSILFAALMGAHFLGEGDAKRRTLAAAGMAVGVIGLATG